MGPASMRPRSHRDSFLIVAVVSVEVLRAQEEWDVVDAIHPDPGKCRNGAEQHS